MTTKKDDSAQVMLKFLPFKKKASKAFWAQKFIKKFGVFIIISSMFKHELYDFIQVKKYKSST